MTPEVKAVMEAVAEWIDTKAIAETILDTLDNAGIELTAETAQKVWLNFLYTELGEGLRRSVENGLPLRWLRRPKCSTPKGGEA